MPDITTDLATMFANAPVAEPEPEVPEAEPAPEDKPKPKAEAKKEPEVEPEPEPEDDFDLVTQDDLQAMEQRIINAMQTQQAVSQAPEVKLLQPDRKEFVKGGDLIELYADPERFGQYLNNLANTIYQEAFNLAVQAAKTEVPNLVEQQFRQRAVEERQTAAFWNKNPYLLRGATTKEQVQSRQRLVEGVANQLYRGNPGRYTLAGGATNLELLADDTAKESANALGVDPAEIKKAHALQRRRPGGALPPKGKGSSAAPKETKKPGDSKADDIEATLTGGHGYRPLGKE